MSAGHIAIGVEGDDVALVEDEIVDSVERGVAVPPP